MKWSHFQELYDKHLSGDTILEIGIYEGASLLKHKERFKHVLGIDVNHQPVSGCTTYIGNINNPAFKRRVKNEILFEFGLLDAIIDDGCHRPFAQYETFKSFWPLIKEGGTYCVEDIHMAEKLRWRIWSWFPLPSTRSLLMELYKDQNRFSACEDLPRQRPYEISLYPNIMFIKKKTWTIASINTKYEES